MVRVCPSSEQTRGDLEHSQQDVHGSWTLCLQGSQIGADVTNKTLIKALEPIYMVPIHMASVTDIGRLKWIDPTVGALYLTF